MKTLTALFFMVFMAGCGAEEAPVVQPLQTPLEVKIAKECGNGGTCFVVPASALHELEERFTTLKKMIAEKNKVISDMKDEQSKTCISFKEE